MNKWFNKQKPITLGFITAISAFIMCFTMLKYFSISGYDLALIKASGAICTIMFFLSWMMFSSADSSQKVFKEIESLYFRAKKAKTKEDLTDLENIYIILRKKCQHQNHYYKMNEIWQIITTKKEFL